MIAERFLPIKVVQFCTMRLIEGYFLNLSQTQDVNNQDKELPLFALVRLHEIVGQRFEQEIKITNRSGQRTTIYNQIEIAYDMIRRKKVYDYVFDAEFDMADLCIG